LADHHRVGKRFVPPLVHSLGSVLAETPWVKVTIPEIIWIALLHRQASLRSGTDLALKLAKTAREAAPDSTKWFAATSDYSVLTTGQQTAVVCRLAGEEATLPTLRTALNDLVVFYPQCPFGFLYDQEPELDDDWETALEDFKATIVTLFDKTTREAILAQGTVVYIGGVTGRLRYAANSALADLPDLADYPSTEKSRVVAAAVRSTVPVVLLGLGASYQSDWSRYFWNRGLELEPCSLVVPSTDQEVPSD